MIVGTLSHYIALATLLFGPLLLRQPLSLRLRPHSLGFGGPPRLRLQKRLAGFCGTMRLVEGELRLLDKSLLPPVKLGIATGRTAGETAVGLRLMGWEDVFPSEGIVTEDDGFLKPDPRILKLAVDRLGAERPMYVGDTPDDLLTVKRYNEEYGGMLACMVRTGLPGGDGEADIIADNVNAALIAVNRCIGGEICPDEKQR